MDLSEWNAKINGLVPNVLYGQNERVDDLNERILGRFQSDQPLNPNINVRPVPTKYSHFPIIDRIVLPKVPLQIHGDYSVDQFAPIQSRGPVDGYFSNVDSESSLRNQFYAIQRGAPQGVFIPSSNSDLYSVKMAVPVTRNEEQIHPLLFEKYEPQFQQGIIKNADPKVGNDRFFNYTRTQLRGGRLSDE